VGGIEVVGEAADGWQAISQIDTLRPDVILMDLEMPGLDGYEATRHIKCRHPACRIVALTVHDYAAAHHRANHAGVDAFIVKGAPVETLVRAIKGRSAQ
jgi:DNA-binding NarL/FixJ family response regulator